MDVVTHIIKYNGQSTGRDKLCRLFQYASKYAWWYATQHDRTDLSKKFKNLENSLSASRKVLRIGKSLDMIQSALKGTRAKDPIIRVCIVISKLSQAVYLLVDHFVWGAKIGISDANAKDLSRIAARFWLISLICNLIRNLYDIRNILVVNARARRKVREEIDGEGPIARYSQEEFDEKKQSLSGFQAVISNRPVVVDFVKNSADFLLPLNSLGFINTPVPFQGMLGMISSIMGIMTVWNSSLKLSH